VRTVREECLDNLIILNETHLRQLMRDDVDHYNNAHPIKALGSKRQHRKQSKT
jgi:hypothetical protein